MGPGEDGLWASIAFLMKGPRVVGSGAVGIGSAADGGRVVGVQTWRSPPGTHHRGEELGGAWGSLCFPALFFLSFK